MSSLDPPNKELTKIKQKDGKLYIEISMKVYPLPHCTIFYEVCIVDCKQMYTLHCVQVFKKKIIVISLIINEIFSIVFS